MENRHPSADSDNLVTNNCVLVDLDSSWSSSQSQSLPDANESQIIVPKRSQPKRKELPQRLSSTEVSLTMSVEDIAQRIAGQLDVERERNGGFLRLEERCTDDESFDLTSTFKTKESTTRSKIIKIFKQLLKKCGYIVAATVAVPLIAGAGAVTVVVVTAAGIVSIPVLYGLNKQRRDLGLEPYAYSSVLEGLFKLFEILAAKVGSLKMDDSCSFSDIDDERVEEIARDWDEGNFNPVEGRVQYFPGRGTDEESVTELDVSHRVFWEAVREGKLANDVKDWNGQGNITTETRSHVLREEETSDKENRVQVSKWGDTQGRVFFKSSPKEVTPKDVRNCGEETSSTTENHSQVSLENEKVELEVVENVRDCDCEEEPLSTRVMSPNDACTPVSLEKEARKGTGENVRDKDEGNFSMREDGCTVLLTKETSKQIGKKVKGRGKRKKTINNWARARASVGIETAEGTAQVVLAPNEKKVTKERTHDQVSMEKGTAENKKDCDEKGISIHNSNAQVFMGKESGKDFVDETRALDEKNVTSFKTSVQGLVEKENEEGTKESLRTRDNERQTGPQVISELQQTVRSTELQAHEEAGSSVPIPSTAVAYFDESQVNSQLDINAIVVLHEILEADKESKALKDVENQLSEGEGSQTGALQLTNGRQALSDEENIYGRQDIQCPAPKRTNSDTFSCTEKRDETFPSGDKRREFVRFSGHSPFTRLQYHNEVEQTGKKLDQEGDGSETETQIRGAERDCAIRGQEMGEMPDKEPKKGKRRRKRRNNKRNTLENPTGLAGNEADDELDKEDLEKGATIQKVASDQNNAQKATDLQCNKTTSKNANSDQTNEQKATSNKEKRPVKLELDEISKAANDANVSPEKTAKKTMDLKNRDKAKKELAAKIFVTSEERKGRIFRFLSRKNANRDAREENTTDSKSDSDAKIKNDADFTDCDATKKNTADTKDYQRTKRCTADLRDCDVTKTGSAHPQNSNDQKKSNPSVSRSPRLSGARTSKVAVVGNDQKKSNVTARKSPSLSSARSLKVSDVDGGCAAKITSATHTVVEEENDCDAILSLYDDID